MWLTVRNGPRRGATAEIVDAAVVVGRDDDCDLVLEDLKSSRRHARLEPQPDGTVALRDLGSSNGTYVDGERVEAAVLRGGEQLQFGDAVVTLSLEQPRTGRSTILGSRLGGVAQTPSAIHRAFVERSVRRATVLAGTAVAAVLVVTGLFLSGVISGGGDSAVERVVSGAAPATVLVNVQRKGASAAGGSGWVLDAREGLIVTNAHVVNDGTRFRVGVANSLRDARVVAVAPCDDLALLRLSDTSGLRALPLGTQSSLRPGETVVAVGYPSNASQAASLTSTSGVVSVVRTAYREPALDVPRYPNVVQTDAAINPGNSGGPLLDLQGRLVGVVSAGRTLAPGGRIIQGQGYAIGVDRVKEVLLTLRTGRSIGWSGLGFDYPTAAELERDDLPAGLVAAAAVDGTGAAKAGLGERRELLLSVNGAAVGNSLAGYCDVAGGLRSGTVATFRLLDPKTRQRRDVRVRMQ